MEVIRLGEFNPEAMEKKVTIQPLDCAVNMANNSRNNFACLKRLSYLLEYLEKMYPKKHQKYVDNLTKKFHQLSEEEFFIDINSKFEEILKENNHLIRFPELTKATLKFYLELLKIPQEVNWINDTIEVKQGDYIRSFLIPTYYFLEVLIATLGKETATSFFKRYISSFLDNELSKLPINFITLTDTFNRAKQSVGSPSDWVMVIGLLSESKYIFRNDNCLWIDALKDLPNQEIKYFICCYGDYQKAYSGSNGHAILTMEHTIAQGDPYCSRVKHDTRFDWNLEHPKKEVFDNLWPLANKKE